VGTFHPGGGPCFDSLLPNGTKPGQLRDQTAGGGSNEAERDSFRFLFAGLAKISHQLFRFFSLNSLQTFRFASQQIDHINVFASHIFISFRFRIFPFALFRLRIVLFASFRLCIFRFAWVGIFLFCVNKNYFRLF
jgi:hypothetical protein